MVVGLLFHVEHMTTVEIPKSPVASRALAPAGSWWPNRSLPGRMVAPSIKCPLCARTSYLPHDIAVDGLVTPSVVCPHSGCSWHVFVKLLNWVPICST